MKEIIQLIKEKFITFKDQEKVLEIVKEALKEDRLENKRWLETYIRMRKQQHLQNLDGWGVDGYLLPTEPDPEERRAIRRELNAAIHELDELVKEFDLKL